MLIRLDRLCAKYRIHEYGVLHIGAHHAEERSDYQSNNARRVLWVEANPELADRLKDMISKDHRNFMMEDVISAAIFDIDAPTMAFHIANNTQSSSLLEFGIHKKYHPDIDTVKTIEVVVKRIDTLAGERPDLFQDLDFANLDIQGVELAALRGFGGLLDQFKWIYTEVNRREVYKNNGLIWDLDRFLLRHGFFRKDTAFTDAGWGDAFYQKEPHRKKASILAYKIRTHCEYFLWRASSLLIVNIPIRILRKLRRMISR